LTGFPWRSQLWNAFHAPEDVEAALDETLSRLGISYLDMYLIHWPVAILKEPYLTSGRFVVDKPLSNDMFPTWKKLEELVDKGKIRNIGVCKCVLFT
jgi:diketogulonate reductase-like aldo/keto reductase